MSFFTLSHPSSYRFDLTNGKDNTKKEQIPEQISDFNDGANALWSLYEDEAKSHDAARIETLKKDMDGVLLFVR